MVIYYQSLEIGTWVWFSVQLHWTYQNDNTCLTVDIWHHLDESSVTGHWTKFLPLKLRYVIFFFQFRGQWCHLLLFLAQKKSKEFFFLFFFFNVMLQKILFHFLKVPISGAWTHFMFLSLGDITCNKNIVVINFAFD